MAAHLTEEEQIEALKRWWKDNGKFTVALIAAGLLAWFGWNMWQDRQERLAQEASAQYTELLAVFDAAPLAEVSDEQAATARVLATELVNNHGGSLYGNFASMLLADLAIEDQDYTAAEEHLRTARSNAANAGIEQLTSVRLARVLAAQGNFDAALENLPQTADSAFAAAVAEVRGDIHMAQNQMDLAHTAYQEAISSLQPEQAGRRGLLQLKLDNSATAPASGANPEQAAQEGGA